MAWLSRITPPLPTPPSHPLSSPLPCFVLLLRCKARIEAAGGFVSPPPEPGLSSRVWLDAAMTQIGLAMARSIGDHAVKSIGVVAEPEVTTHTIAVRQGHGNNRAVGNLVGTTFLLTNVCRVVSVLSSVIRVGSTCSGSPESIAFSILLRKLHCCFLATTRGQG